MSSPVRWRRSPGASSITATRLRPRHVVILDEAGMSSDTEVAKLLGGVAASGARAVIVGDYHQLDAVGPGGALEALAARHPDHVWTLSDNLRQRDPAERHALDQLRAGHVPSAVGWYALQGRVHPASSRGQAMVEMVRAWAFATAEGKDALLVAYHRDAVDGLNRAARAVWDKLGDSPGRSWRHPAAGATGPATGWSPSPPGPAVPGSPPSGLW